MIKGVFDSSAILALIYDEPGKARVRSLLDACNPLISTVNLCEILSKLLNDGLTEDIASEMLLGLDIEIIDFANGHAKKAAELRPLTKHLGLSLGDRACLALAIQENATAVTADKNWAKVDVCLIEIIR